MSKKLIKIDELKEVMFNVTVGNITHGKACEQISDICVNRALNIDSVSVSDLVEERKQWLLDNVWCCEEEDLNPRELHNFKMGLEQDKLVIEWVHSR